MSDKRFRDDDGKLDLGKIERYEDSSYKIVLLLKYIEEQQDTIQSLKKENEQLKYIDNPIDEEMTNIECLILLIPFGILFILLTGIIISFIVQLGWVVI